MTRIPGPRADLEIERAPDRWTVRDRATGLVAHLGPSQIAIFESLRAGHDTPAELMAALSMIPPAQIHRTLQGLDEGLMLEGDRWQAQRPLFEAARAEAEIKGEIHLHPDLGHACVGCGSSCHGADMGPVPPRTVEAIRAHGLWRDSPTLTRPEEAVEIQDRRLAVMARAGSGCVMLDTGGGCRVHRAAGAAAKPGACSQFPFTLTQGPDGLYVGLQMECRSFSPSSQAGATIPMARRRAEVEAILRRDAQVIAAPSPVPLAPGVYAPWAEYTRWWAATVEEIQRGASLAQVVQSLDAWIEQRSASWRAPWMSDPAWGEDALAFPGPPLLIKGLLRALVQACEEALGQLRGAWSQEGELMEQCRKALMVMLGVQEIAPMRWADGSGPDLLRVHRLASVHGHTPILRGDLYWGLGHLALVSSLAISLASLRAWQGGRVVIHGQDVNDGLVIAQRSLRVMSLASTLRRHGSAIRGFQLSGPGLSL